MNRVHRSPTERLRIFMARGGVCALCGGKIGLEPWDLDHARALALLGEDDEANLVPVHRACHRGKTKDDVARISKAKRVEVKHLGAKVARRPMPGSKASGWKKRMDGKVERR